MGISEPFEAIRSVELNGDTWLEAVPWRFRSTFAMNDKGLGSPPVDRSRSMVTDVTTATNYEDCWEIHVITFELEVLVQMETRLPLLTLLAFFHSARVR